MQLPLQITFKNLEPSPAIEARVRRRAAWLERYFSPIISCRVVIESPHRHHRKGGTFDVRIDLKISGTELSVRNLPGAPPHRDVYVAIRDAFHTARRELEDFVKRRRDEARGSDRAA